jgi:hypothetical protein
LAKSDGSERGGYRVNEPDVNGAVVVRLRQITETHGGEISEDPRLVEALLRDISGEHRREIILLVSAVEEGVPAELLESGNSALLPMLVERLAQRLQNHKGLTADGARWAVVTWASALGVTGFAPPAPASDLPDYSRSQAILIGTAAYQDPRLSMLPAVDGDLTGMQLVLTSPDAGGWPEDRVTVMRDPTTHEAIRTLRDVAASAEDVLLVYFSGHVASTPRGELILFLSETDFDRPEMTGLPHREVRSILRESLARRKVLMLDGSYSGSLSFSKRRGVTAAELADLVDTEGIYTLIGIESALPAGRGETRGASTFTGELLDLIRTGVPGGPQELTLGALYPELRRRLELRGLPAPAQRGAANADSISLARNAVNVPIPMISEHEAEPAPIVGQREQSIAAGNKVRRGRRFRALWSRLIKIAIPSEANAVLRGNPDEMRAASWREVEGEVGRAYTALGPPPGLMQDLPRGQGDDRRD